MTGCLDILNCGAGHLSIKFDKENPGEAAEAKKIVTDMLRRGYTIVVEDEQGTHKVDAFDPERGEYIVRDMTPDEAVSAEAEPKKKAKKTRRVPMQTAKATGIGRTSGG